MVKDKDIKQFFQQHKPDVKNNGPFLKEVVRQINAMPIPAAMNPDRQKEDCIRLVLEVSRRDLRAVRLAELYLVLHGDAPFYILDEPFTQVDPVNIEDVKSMIRERANDHGVIITDHNYDAISSVADNL